MPGTGAVAAAGNEISVHYTGWLYNANGANFKSTKFDSSRDRGTPFNFTLGIGAVIAGWDRGVAGMKVGGKRTLIIPASLGYGGTGNASIPPNAGMVFEVELLTVIR
ncbi:MAG: FKBP-type peptidyl-prolyl cis-trans isomerase [Telluria sp.]|nr:FKBP-type peptidyl-prolyl cis-trans isomerase [Telluria sp.]